MMEMKTIFDYQVALILLILLFPVMLLVALLIFLIDGSPVFYRQIRIGRGGRPFQLVKFRTMRAASENSPIAAEERGRVTRVGRFLRKSKLDELPELLNILKGEMSFVGPRPDVAGYADKLERGNRIILSIKPGLTGLASIKYRSEEELLRQQADPGIYNDTIIWPDKVRLNRMYVEHWSFWLDIKILFYTLIHKPFDIEALQDDTAMFKSKREKAV
jgi:lipopolysaccharide/colanic/teichoic acid biosynthesis glycosyltransferase